MGALTDLPMSMPVVLGWAAWLAAGLALVVWARHARADGLSASVMRPGPRLPKTHPLSGVRPPKPPAAGSDAFDNLQALLDPPSSAARRPGDEP